MTQFHSLSRIETVTAIGFSLFVSAVSPWKSVSGREVKDSLDKENPYNKYSSLLNGVAHFVIGLSMLGMGYIVHHFFM